MEPKKIPIEFNELLKLVPGTIADPVPYFTKFLDDTKLKEFVKLELEFKTKILKNQLEILENQLEITKKMEKFL